MRSVSYKGVLPDPSTEGDAPLGASLPALAPPRTRPGHPGPRPTAPPAAAVARHRQRDPLGEGGGGQRGGARAGASRRSGSCSGASSSSWTTSTPSRARCASSSAHARLALHERRRRPHARRRHHRSRRQGVRRRGRLVARDGGDAPRPLQERCTEGHLRMALVPEGAALEVTAEVTLAHHPPREHLALAGHPGGLPDEAPGRRRRTLGRRRAAARSCRTRST